MTPTAARKMASRPTIPRAWRAPAEARSTGVPATAPRRSTPRQIQGPPAATSGWRSPRSAGSCRSAPGGGPPRLRGRGVPVPSRRWGNCPDDPTGFADALGMSKWSPLVALGRRRSRSPACDGHMGHEARYRRQRSSGRNYALALISANEPLPPIAGHEILSIRPGNGELMCSHPGAPVIELHGLQCLCSLSFRRTCGAL